MMPPLPPCCAARNTIISAVSNLSTAYNLVVISIVHVLIENQYCSGLHHCTAEVTSAATASLVGAIFGQLTFGYVGDWLGRGQALRLTMALTVIGALLSACAVPITHQPESIFLFLAATRFVLGIGLGGVYPLSATIAAESSDASNRGRNASLVFSMQGVAYLLVPVLAQACTSGLGEPRIGSEGSSWGWSWRVLLGLGAVPGILLAPFKVGRPAHATRHEHPPRLGNPRPATRR